MTLDPKGERGKGFFSVFLTVKNLEKSEVFVSKKFKWAIVILISLVVFSGIVGCSTFVGLSYGEEEDATGLSDMIMIGVLLGGIAAFVTGGLVYYGLFHKQIEAKEVEKKRVVAEQQKAESERQAKLAEEQRIRERKEQELNEKIKKFMRTNKGSDKTLKEWLVEIGEVQKSKQCCTVCDNGVPVWQRVRSQGTGVVTTNTTHNIKRTGYWDAVNSDDKEWGKKYHLGYNETSHEQQIHFDVYRCPSCGNETERKR